MLLPLLLNLTVTHSASMRPGVSFVAEFAPAPAFEAHMPQDSSRVDSFTTSGYPRDAEFQPTWFEEALF